MKIPIFDLTRQYKSIEREMNSALLRTVRKGYFTLGPEVEKFEKSFATYVGSRHAIGVGSGTDALALALRSLKLNSSDEVVIPANSYPSAFGLSLSGQRLGLIDVDAYGNMDIKKLPGMLTQRTKAIIPVHLYGNPVDVPAIQKILNSSKNWSHIKIIEDCAQAHGATIKGKQVGSFGTIGCFSFYPSKNLGAYGDGGMLVTNNSQISNDIHALRMYGETSRYKSTMMSGVSRLDELQAAVLRVKLRHLNTWNANRRKIADRYIQELQKVGDLRFLYPNPDASLQSANHLFVIRTKQRNALKKYLASSGIQTAIHYPIPIHLAKSFKFLGYKKGDFPISETLSHEVLSLPLFPELTIMEQETVIQHVKRFYR